MFRKRPAIQAVTSALLLICYIVLAGASAVHEVAHIGNGHPRMSAAGHLLPKTADVPDSHNNHGHDASLSCFLCLIGSQHSTPLQFSYAPHLITTENKERIAEIPQVLFSRYILPSLRAPPAAC